MRIIFELLPFMIYRSKIKNDLTILERFTIIREMELESKSD